MLIARKPMAALSPFVSQVWASSEDDEAPPSPRERVLPTGAMHLAIRLAGPPLRVFRDASAGAPTELGHAVVGGARAVFYVREVSAAVAAVGAMLKPGAGSLFLGVPADLLAGLHTPLDALWGSAVARFRARLADVRSLEARLALFEALLTTWLPRVSPLHPAVAEALARFERGAGVGEAVARSGYSHRRFNTLFREAVGLPPKLFCRVRRFAGALAQADLPAGAPRWAALALSAGYSDQPHFCRDFRAFTGLSPGAYGALRPRSPHHVPIVASPPPAEFNSVQDTAAEPAQAV